MALQDRAKYAMRCLAPEIEIASRVAVRISAGGYFRPEEQNESVLFAVWFLYRNKHLISVALDHAVLNTEHLGMLSIL